MAILTRSSNVVPLENRRVASRDPAEIERRGLEAVRAQLEKDREALDAERRSFDEDLGVLEEQRRFLASQKEVVRTEASALEARWQEVLREREAVAKKAADLAALEQTLGQALRQVENERRELQAEFSRLRSQRG